MKRFSLFPWLALLALSLALTGCGPREIVLQFAPQAGEVYQVDSVMEQDMTQSFGGQEMTISQRFEYGYTWAIREVSAEGNITVEVTYNHIATEQSFGDQAIAYDSAVDEAPPPELAGMDLMLGQSFTMVLSPRGQVLEINGLDEMYQAIVEASTLPEEQKAAFAQALEDSYGATALQEQFSSMLVPYDGQPLTEGHSWTIEQQLNGLVPVAIHTVYTVQGWDEETAQIAIASTLQSDPDKVTSLGGYQVSYDMTGTQEGVFSVSLTDGVTREASLNQHLEGSMTISQGEAALPVPLVMDTVMTYRMTKK